MSVTQKIYLPLKLPFHCRQLIIIAVCVAPGCGYVRQGELNSLQVENKILREQNQIQSEELLGARQRADNLAQRLAETETELARRLEAGSVRR